MSANFDSRLDSIMKFLEDMRAETKKEFGFVKKEIRTLKKELGTVKKELGTVKKELGTVKQELGTVKQELGTVKKELGTVKEEVGTVKKELGTVKKELVTVKEGLGTVKTKCVRIEKEILRITAESKVNLMETTTVRDLVEKLTFDVGTLTVESNNARAAAERQKENGPARKDLHSEFFVATVEKIKSLQQKYDVVTRKTFHAEFSNFLVEFRSQTEKLRLELGISSSVMHAFLEDITKTADSDELYDEHFLEKYEEIEILIREKYEDLTEVYAKRAVFRMDNFDGIAHKLVTEFLNKWKLCPESFDSFREELLDEFQEIAEQIEANRGLLNRLCQVFHDRLYCKPKDVVYLGLRQGSFDAMMKEIKVSNPKLVEIFMEKLSRNMYDISALDGRGFTIEHSSYFNV